MRFKANSKTEIKNVDLFSKNFKSIAIFVVIFSFLIILQIFRWQVLETTKFKSIADGQYTEKQRNSSGRGIIYGANNSVLAIDEPSWSVYATLGTDPSERELFFNNKEKFVAEIAGILEIEKKEIDSKIHNNFHYFLIAEKIPNDKKKAIEEANIFGQGYESFALYFEKEERRPLVISRYSCLSATKFGQTKEFQAPINFKMKIEMSVGMLRGTMTFHK